MGNQRKTLVTCLALFLLSWVPAPGAAAETGWLAVESTGSPHVRHESSFVESGGRFYLLGGRRIQPVDIFDPQTGAWSEGQPPPIELHHFQAQSYKGLIYVIAALTGRYPGEKPTEHIYIYDPAKDEWRPGAQIPAERRRGSAAVALHEGRFYVVAGIRDGHRSGWVPWLDVYDPATDEWSVLPDAPRSRDHFHAAVIDGKLYAAGGRRSGSSETVFSGTVAEVDVYDIPGETWATLPSYANIPTQRAGTTVAVIDNRLVIMGGESPDQKPAHGQLEALDPARQEWLTLPPLLTPRHGAQALIHNNAVYIAGGNAKRGGGAEVVALEKLPVARKNARPNIVLIMADDMGWSDIGVYGGEIPTPNIDRLGENGVRFSQFYNMARCYPTRASLLTGLHPHQAGIGGATNSPRGLIGDHGVYGYRGFLNRNSVTMAEALGAAGYHSYMAGKWHLGYHTPDRWPLQRGFERFYGAIAGATSYLKPQGGRGMMLDNTPLAPPEGEFYTTDAFTDHAIQFIAEQQDEAPFFLYLAYTAPHWPLHAREEDIAKFVGKYRDIGWDKLREQRLQRQSELGVLKKSQALSPRNDGARPWAELTDEQKDQLDYRMAVYAAQVYRMDHNIGRLVDFLEERGELDNTLILFLSDNGGCAEPYDDLGGKDFSLVNDENYGGMVSYGQGWANASNTPFRRFKVWLNEGGISTPLIAHWPKGIKDMKGRWLRMAAWVPDLMPTVLDATGADYPEQHNGYTITPYVGQSMLRALQEGDFERDRWMFWEHMNHRAVRQEDWKALLEREPHGSGQWQLFDMSADRNELNNLAQDHPERLARMKADWEDWAWKAHVLPKPPKLQVPEAPKVTWPSYQQE